MLERMPKELKSDVEAAMKKAQRRLKMKLKQCTDAKQGDLYKEAGRELIEEVMSFFEKGVFDKSYRNSQLLHSEHLFSKKMV